MNRIFAVVATSVFALWSSVAVAQDNGVTGAAYQNTTPGGGGMQGGQQGTMGQGGQMGQGGMAQGQQGSDGSILNQVHQTNLAEIQEGKLAEKNAQSKKVKDFGKELVRDHEKADKEVQKEAKKMGVALSDTPAEQDQINALQGMSGSDFDKTFVKDEVEGHQKTISMINDSMESLQNKSEKKTLKKILPTLQKHLKTAQKLQREVGESASAD